MPGKPAGKFTRVAPTEKPAAPRTSGSSRAARRCVTVIAQIRQAKLTHENFLREYGDAVKGVPLVIYEGRVNRQSKRPFKLAPGK